MNTSVPSKCQLRSNLQAEIMLFLKLIMLLRSIMRFRTDLFVVILTTLQRTSDPSERSERIRSEYLPKCCKITTNKSRLRKSIINFGEYQYV